MVSRARTVSESYLQLRIYYLLSTLPTYLLGRPILSVFPPFPNVVYTEVPSSVEP